MALIEAIGLLAIVVALGYYWVTKNNGYWAERGIPYAKPVPLFGNLLETILLRKNQGQIFTDIYRKFKGEQVVGTFNFMTPALMIRDVNLVNQFLTTDFQYFAYNDLEVDEKLDPIFSRNMFSQRDQMWKRTRQSLTPAFSLARVKSAFPNIQNTAYKLIKWLENNPEAEVKSTMSLYTSEIFASTGAGIDGHSFSEENPILPRLGKMIFDASFEKTIKFIVVTYSPLVAKLFRVRFVPQEVPDFFDGMLRDIIKQREASTDNHNDLLQHYIDMRRKRQVQKHDDQNDVTEDDIVGGLTTFFIESYETVALVTSNVIFELVKNQKLQSELRQEVDRVFEKLKGEISLEDILEMQLLERISLEATRFYGTQFLFKQCSKDYDLELNNGKKLRIPKGSSITIPLQGIQTDDEFWETPLEFDPQHFSEEAKATRNKNAYFPFGEGPRMCIGMRLAKVMMKTAVVYLIRNFNLVPNSKTGKKFIQDPAHFMTYMKGGVHCKFVKRELPL